MPESRWYAVRSVAHKEEVLFGQLISKKIPCFLPRVRVNPINPRSAKWRPFFPNYMFVKIELADVGPSAFNYIPFSQGLVEFGGQPASIPDGVVKEIHDHMDAINAKGGLSHVDLQPGTPIRIVDGPFRGYEGIFDLRLSGTDRVMILLNLIKKRQLRVEMHVGAVRKLSR